MKRSAKTRHQTKILSILLTLILLTNIFGITANARTSYEESGEPELVTSMVRDVTADTNFVVACSLKDIVLFDEITVKVFRITYDPAQVTLLDFAAQTQESNVDVGTVPGTGLEIMSHDTETGELLFQVTKTLPTNMMWTEVLTLLKFNASVTCSTEIVLESMSFTLPKLDDYTLASLTVSAGTLSPTFNPDIKWYDVTVAENVTSITIGATANSSNSIVTGDIGTKSLSIGINTFKITVTAEDGTVTTYTIMVTRGDIVPATLTVGIKTLSAKVGKQQKLPVTYTGTGANWDDVKFTTTNSLICAVDQDGVITPLKAGIAVIMITAPGLAPAAVTVTVTN